MKISNLPSSDAFESGDVLAIEISGKTYKVTGATLAAALEEVGRYVTVNDMATTTVDGLMSAADKNKLDGIAAGAQVNSVTGVKGNAEDSYRSGNVNLTPSNIGSLPDTTTAADIGALPDTATASDIGALPDTTTAADIGASAAFVLTGDQTTAATIYGVLNTMARGSVATIVTRAAASNAMCGVNYDMYGTIWRNPTSTSNNYYLSMTRTSGLEQYCYVLTLTDSSMSHGTVYKYTGTAV